MALLKDHIPAYSSDLLEMSVEEVGYHLVRFLRADSIERERSVPPMGNILRWDVLNNSYMSQYEHGKGALLDVGRLLAEGWAWLERVGYLVQDPERDSGFRFITESGVQFAESPFSSISIEAARLLPRGSLAPELEGDVRMEFIRGDYAKAVFNAMKRVEVVVRQRSGLEDRLGVDLMRQAFKEAGPLADSGRGSAEQQAVADLFAGAIGAFKNPGSHREVHLDDPAEAANVIRLADQLLRMSKL